MIARVVGTGVGDGAKLQGGMLRWMGLLAMTLVALGLLFRLVPVGIGQPVLAEQFLTEDGYLMLTVARNIAIGAGMSVSDGTMATNGVQPLATFLFAVPYALTGGDKVASLIGVHLIAAGAALAGAFVLRAFAGRVLAPLGAAPVWAWAVVALWFCSPVLLRHSMNGLETGLYTLVLLATLLQFGHVLGRGGEAGRGASIALGALCGVTFLARNDGAFLVIAVFAIWGMHALLSQRRGLGGSLAAIVPAGLVTLFIAAPWLVNNHLRFGSIVPVSGTAQSLDVPIGANLPALPVKLGEYLFPMVPVPAAVEGSPALASVLAVVGVAILGWFLFRVARTGGPIRWVVLAYVAHGVALATYYGMFFGAPHFISRYLAPLAPLLILASIVSLRDLARLVAGTRSESLAAGVTTAALLLAAALAAWVAVPRPNVHGHMQVVRWVDENVDDATWVGAVQTGTLGYWHDRTINLDGKVNPQALAERRTTGTVLPYVVDSEIVYIADWNGIAAWAEMPDGGFDAAFELIVDRPEENLAVLRRRNLP